MFLKYFLATCLMWTTATAIASTAPASEPAKEAAPAPTPASEPAKEAALAPTPAPEPAKEAAPAPKKEPTPAAAPTPAPAPAPDPDPNPIRHEIMNALAVQKNSSLVKESIKITIENMQYTVDVALKPRGTSGFPTLEEALTTVPEDKLNATKEKDGQYESYVCKNGNKIGIKYVGAGALGANDKLSKLTLQFKKVS